MNMKSAPDIDTLLRQNPAGRRDEVVIREATEIIATLRRSGVDDKTYDLERPFRSKDLGSGRPDAKAVKRLLSK